MGVGRDEVTELLRRAGLRPTAQRRTVLAGLLDCPGPMTAQELHARLRRTGRSVGLSTVYRTLTALAESGSLHTFARHHELAFRRCTERLHEHLICTRCGRIDDLAAAEGRSAGSTLAELVGFTVHSRRTDFYGVCPSC